MKKSTKLAICLVLPLSGAVFSAAAVAASSTTVVPVSATVIDSCTVDATPLTFGNYNSLSAGMHDTAASISPLCTNGTFYTIALDAGVGAGASVSARKLSATDGSTLNYGVYTDAARTTLWGDASGGTVAASGTGTGATQTLTMYARIPSLQPSPVGSYSDVLTVTLSY